MRCKKVAQSTRQLQYIRKMSCWTINVKGNPKLAGFPTVVALRDKIYFFDDYDEDNLTSMGPLDVQVFKTDTYEWSVLKNENFSLDEMQPHLLHWHTAVVYKDLVYLLADINEESWKVLFVYDTNSNVWSKPVVTGVMPATAANFSGHSTCVVNDAIYMFRGFDGDLCLYSQDVYKLDLISKKWSLVTTTGEPPMHRVGQSASAIKNCIFIYGGAGDEGIAYEDVVYLDTQTMTWITAEVIGYRPVGRIAPSAVCYKGSLLVFGGVDSDLQTAYNDFVLYDPDSRCWSVVETKGDRPSPRHHQSCVLVQNRVFVLGGLQSLWHTSVHRSDPPHGIHVCDFAPSLKTWSILAVLEHKLNQKSLPETVRSDIKLFNAEAIESGNNDE